ncbi:hypothetical protein C2E23DRAFT_829186 [Lenzites betulinus]|nr:hypothetical protein C2E23DRAFT_829186 [Lenzites betulinus]
MAEDPPSRALPSARCGARPTGEVEAGLCPTTTVTTWPSVAAAAIVTTVFLVAHRFVGLLTRAEYTMHQVWLPQASFGNPGPSIPARDKFSCICMLQPSSYAKNRRNRALRSRGCQIYADPARVPFNIQRQLWRAPHRMQLLQMQGTYKEGPPRGVVRAAPPAATPARRALQDTSAKGIEPSGFAENQPSATGFARAASTPRPLRRLIGAYDNSAWLSDPRFGPSAMLHADRAAG